MAGELTFTEAKAEATRITTLKQRIRLRHVMGTNLLSDWLLRSCDCANFPDEAGQGKSYRAQADRLATPWNPYMVNRRVIPCFRHVKRKKGMYGQYYLSITGKKTRSRTRQ